MGVGEAVTSFLIKKGIPGVAERTLIRPPSSQLGPLDMTARRAVIANSPVVGKYETVMDRNSAFEMLKARADAAAKAAEEAEAREEEMEAREREYQTGRRYSGTRVGRSSAKKRKTRSRRSDTAGEAFAKSMMRSIGTKAGTAIVRGIMGSLFKGR